ncbi:hypothetical protein C8R46DRAFT_1160102 [Mycena filopes]|nr:hypothetical protein C8R46DRAFT_1160102 [Mycena filopes]
MQESCGYMLRPRYRPDWVPSWQGKDMSSVGCEDGLRLQVRYPLWFHMNPADFFFPPIIDAIRMEDGVNKETDDFEHELTSFFSSPALASDPRNHCVPLLATLLIPDDPNQLIMVMPLLLPYSKPRFDTFGEALDFFGQIFEGIKFMHDHNVAHRDCTGQNILMEAAQICPKGFHPVTPSHNRNRSGRAQFYYTTQKPPKYFWIDFGISRRYNARSDALMEPIQSGGDKTVPEFRPMADGEFPIGHDPFPTDIYYLENMILREFINGGPLFTKLYGFDFMEPLVLDMVVEDPAKRPTIDEVGIWKLRSRVVKAGGFPSLSRPLKHWYCRIGYILRHVPAIPSPAK